MVEPAGFWQEFEDFKPSDVQMQEKPKLQKHINKIEGGFIAPEPKQNCNKHLALP